MDTLQITFIAIIISAVIAIGHMLTAKPTTGSAIIAAMLCAGFAAYTGVQIWHEGVMLFWENHTQNLTGIQVWWDLVMAVVTALFFIAPRARDAGMNVPVWTLLVVATASIGLLAMVARLFWLESQSAPAPDPAKA